MKVEMKPVINSNDLEEQIEAQYNLDLRIPEVLFPEDFTNDCFKEYYYKDVWETRFFRAMKRVCESICAMYFRSMIASSLKFLGN